MPEKNKKNVFVEYWRAIINEFIVWARLPWETKFVVALILLILAFFVGNNFQTLGSFFNVWGVIIFFEAILQNRLKWEQKNNRELIQSYLVAGILGTLVGSFLLLYFDVLYFLRLSIIDFLTRYIWFLLPLSRLHPQPKQKRL